jgi:CRISPR-associated protein Cmr6
MIETDRRLGEIYEELGDLSIASGDSLGAMNFYRQSMVVRLALTNLESADEGRDAMKEREFISVREKYEDLLNAWTDDRGSQIAQEFLGQDYRSNRVPLEYQAQAAGRCQRQFIKKSKDYAQDRLSPAQRWVAEWVDRLDSRSPFAVQGQRLIEVQIDWRLISNSGVDEGFIRPVIGAGGWPLIPGSGIKGLFRRACAPERLERWCGSRFGAGVLRQGILRFHGAWPVDDSWKQGLLDVAHPQQNWQVGFSRHQRQNSHSAFAVASLYRPKLLIGISSIDPSLQEAEWQEIEDTLKRALKRGLGGRTCVGYGSCGRMSGDLIFQCALEGQGPAAKLLDRTPEFRPTMFRAGIRGMALRLFGAVTDARTARQVVGRLFGSISPEDDKAVNVGLLATAYVEPTVALGEHGREGWRQPIYTTTGTLQWRLTRPSEAPQSEELLQELLVVLHGLTMSLGGFGRGWRRPDHRIFLPSYGKTPLGCHWEWRHAGTPPEILQVQTANDLSNLIRKSRSLAQRWLRATNQPMGDAAPWREVIQPDKMLIWTRIASGTDDAEAIHWFHRPRDGEPVQDPRELRKSDLAGKMNQVGCIWNRLLPLEGTSHAPAPNCPAQPAAPMAQSGAGTTRPSAALARPGAATARPGAAMARPGAATARPQAGGAAARQANARSSIFQNSEVWMNYSNGPFLESVVLFPEHCDSDAFIRVLDQGAGAEFHRLRW